MDFPAKRVEATILFTDIRGFTTIANILSLEETHQFLNDCYAPIVEAVYAHNGIVDKFVGDTVMAIFGAPVPHKEPARAAIQCALDIQSQTEGISVNWRQAIDRIIEIDIGIGSGTVIAGNIGHKKRIQYTVVGTPVNLAAQIVHLCKPLNIEVIVDEKTYQQAQDKFNYRTLPEKVIHGFPAPVHLYNPTPI